MSSNHTALPIKISAHAIHRYRQRVAPTATLREAHQAIEEIGRRGHAVEKPRHWMRSHTQQTPATRFIHWCERPGVCLIVAGNTVATVFTREVCRDWPPRSRGCEHPRQNERDRSGSRAPTPRRPRRRKRAGRVSA